MAKDIRAPVTLARIATVAIGIIVMGVGLDSYFESSWFKGHKSCWASHCPSISLERFYVSMIIIFFIISVLGLVAWYLEHLDKYKLFDVGYHGVAALLLFIAAVCYMVSASQINKHTGWPGLRNGEKFVAGVFTLINVIAYGATAFFLLRG